MKQNQLGSIQQKGPDYLPGRPQPGPAQGGQAPALPHPGRLLGQGAGLATQPPRCGGCVAMRSLPRTRKVAGGFCSFVAARWGPPAPLAGARMSARMLRPSIKAR